MKTYFLSMVVASLAMLALLPGCSKPPSAAGLAAESTAKLKALEARVARLEAELKASASARAELQARLETSEQALVEATTKLLATQQKLQVAEARVRSLEQAHDEAQRLAETRTAERDALQVQYESFRKSLRDLLGQAELAAKPSAAAPETPPAAVLPSPRGL
jgi:septal ring factor EnvC (AmiA/AmiB activator)